MTVSLLENVEGVAKLQAPTKKLIFNFFVCGRIGMKVGQFESLSKFRAGQILTLVSIAFFVAPTSNSEGIPRSRLSKFSKKIKINEILKFEFSTKKDAEPCWHLLKMLTESKNRILDENLNCEAMLRQNAASVADSKSAERTLQNDGLTSRKC